jgi:hypothetical protein
MQRFIPATQAHYGEAFGAYSTSTTDALGVARNDYKNSTISKSPVTDYANVKNRYDLVKYVAYRLNYISNYPFSNEGDAKNVAGALNSLVSRYKSNAYVGGLDLIEILNNAFKRAPSRDRREFEKAVQFFANKGLYWLSKAEMATAKALLAGWSKKDEARAVETAKTFKRMDDEAKAEKTKSGFPADMFSSVWNDGKYEYYISSTGTITIGDKKFEPGAERHKKIVAQLLKDRKSGKLVTGRLPDDAKPPRETAPVVQTAAAAEPDAPAAAPELPATAEAPEEGLTDKAWFWPAVVLGVAGTGGAAWYFFFRKKEA